MESNYRDGPTGHKNAFNKNGRCKTQKRCEQGGSGADTGG